MQRAKETAADAAASAKSGMDKTKATLQEKGEKMTTMDPMTKDMAEMKKDDKYYEAEREKEQKREAAAARHGGAVGTGYSAEGPLGTAHPRRGVDESATGRTGVAVPGRDEGRPEVHDAARVAGRGTRTGHGADMF